jgi:acyl-CoA thioesterase I
MRASSRLCIPLLLALTACGDPLRFDALPADAVVLAFGDSVTFGQGAARGEDYPTQLAAITGWQVRNAGIPGETAREAALRIDGALAKAGPALVLVEIGGNDFLRGRSGADVKADLRTIMESVRAAGAIPVLVSVPQFSVIGAVTGRLGDSPIYAEIGEEQHVLVIEAVFAGVLSETALRSDPIHPNAKGYRKFADGVAQALEDAGLLSSARPR